MVVVAAVSLLLGGLLPLPGVSRILGSGPAAAAAGPTRIGSLDITQDTTWGPDGSPYVITGQVRVKPGGTLTVLPGTVVKFMPGYPSGSTNGSELLVYGGQLVADGTPSAPVVFTSGLDGSVGGDSNGDGEASSPKRGDWKAVQFDASTRDDALRAPVSVMDNVVVRFGGWGSSCSTNGAIQVSPVGRVMISRAEITHSKTSGLVISTGISEGVGVATVTSSRFADSWCGAQFEGGEISGSVFESSLARALQSAAPKSATLTGNWFHSEIYVASQPSRQHLDPRNNAFMGPVLTHMYSLPVDLSRNWWGRPLEPKPSGCYDTSTVYSPEVTYEAPAPYTSCWYAAKPEISGWLYKVTPALNAAPPVPEVGVSGVPEPSVSVPTEQTYGAGGGGSSYAYRPVGTQADPVNTATGAFVTSAVDATLPAVGLPLTAARSYDSANSATGPLGRGWSFGYDIRLSSSGEGPITVRTGDGQQLRFHRGEGTGYVGDPGVTATLIDADGGGWTLTTRGQVRHEFDRDGRLVALRASTGQGVDLGYDSAGRLTSVSGSGRVLRLSWDAAANRLTRIDLPDGRWVGYGYTDGLLTTVRDVAGGTTAYEYDAGDRLSKTSSPEGRQVTKQSYDPDTGRVRDQWDGRGNHSVFSWDPVSETASLTDPRGGTWRDVYRGNVLVKRIDPLGGTTSYEYDADLQLIAATNPRGIRSVFAYSDAGDLISHSGPTKSVTSIYDARHRVIGSVNARGIEVNYDYDTDGNLTAVTRPDPDGGAPLITRYGYTDNGLPSTVTDALGNETSYTYNDAGDLVSERSPEGRTVTYTRDSAGRLTSITDPRGNAPGADAGDYTTSYTYDDADRVTRVTDPLGHTSSVTFNKDGLVARVRDAKDRDTTYAHDADGHVTAVQGPDPAISPSQASYDANGNVLTTTDEAGRTTSYTYDLANRVTKAQSPIGTYSLGYDRGGNLTAVTSPTGAKTGLLYDTAGRLAKIDYPTGTPDVTYAYDSHGNRTQMTDGAGTVTYTYDALDRPQSVARGTSTYRYAWDPTGNMTAVTYPDGTRTGYTFDGDGLLKTVTEGTATLATYGHDPAGQLTSATLPDGSTRTRAYDRAGRLTRTTDRSGDTTLLDEAYTLDATGNPTAIEHVDGATDTFSYDPFDQLVKACFNTSTCDENATDFIKWTYDATGNRTRETRPAGTTDYAYNAAGQLTKTTAPDGTSISYSYSANGMRTSAGAETYTYNYAGRLTSSTAGGATSTYSYDGDGRRLSTTTGGSTTKWQWDPFTYDLSLEQDSNNTTIRRYTYGAGRLSMTIPGTGEFTYHTDAIGSVRSLTDDTGAQQWRYNYEPFGAARDTDKVSETAPVNPMRWAGEYSESPGSVHLRARQYDTETGRFDTPDPAGAVTPGATYTYADNNPLTKTDPLGLWPDWSVDDIKNVSTKVSTYAGGAALVLGVTGIGAPVAAVLGAVALGAGAVTAAASAYQAWDTCTNAAKGACGDAIVTAAIDTALALPGAGMGRAGRTLASRAAKTGATACSFSGTTLVLMADGSKKPIDKIKPGDKVLATDPETGKQVAKKVTGTIKHWDRMSDLVLADGTVLRTTEDHPYWSVDDQRFERADQLSAGEKVLSADGRTVKVEGLEWVTGRDGWAYNLSVEGIHTYHVGTQGILVHNTCPTNLFGNGGARPPKAPSYRPTDAGMHPSREAAWEHAVRDQDAYRYAHTRPECSSTVCHVHLDIYNNSGQLLETRHYAYPKP